MKLRSMMALAVTATLFFASSANAAAIALANPGFDADDASGGDVAGATGWASFGGGAFTTDGTNGPGAFPNCCSPVADSLDNSLKLFNTSGTSQDFAATVGDVFTMNAVGLNFGSDPILNASTLRLQIGFFDADGLPAGTAAGGNTSVGFNLFESNLIDANTPLDVWTPLGVGTAPAPDNTATVRFITLYLSSGGAGFIDSTSASLVPEPGSLAALCVGGVGVIARRRRRS